MADLFWGTGQLQECNTCFLSKKVIKKTISHQQNLDPFLSNPFKSTFIFPSASRQRALRKRNYIDIYIDHFPITKLLKRVKTIRHKWYNPPDLNIGEFPGFKTGLKKKTGPNLRTLWYTSPAGIPITGYTYQPRGGSVAWFRARRVLVAKNGGDPGLRWE